MEIKYYSHSLLDLNYETPRFCNRQQYKTLSVYGIQMIKLFVIFFSFDEIRIPLK